MADVWSMADAYANVATAPKKNTWRYLRGLPGASGFGSRATADDVVQEYDGKDRVVLITGAFSGCGLETAKALAKRGAKVVMAGRNLEQGENAKQMVMQGRKDAQVEVMQLDLSSLKSVAQFAKQYKESGHPLHVLVNNAGVMACPFTLSPDGYEMQFATNHLGHFALTKQLLDHMKKGAKDSGVPSRVVSVSSTAHRYPYKEGVRFETLQSPEGYSAVRSYGQSKLCNILFARELQEREDPKEILAVAVHPGVATTNLQRHLPKLLQQMFGWGLFDSFLKSVPQLAATSAFCATNHIQPGAYYEDCNVFETTPMGANRDLGRKLWEYSEQCCNQTS